MDLIVFKYKANKTEIVGFNMSYLDLVTLETLITPLKEKNVKDLLIGIFVLSNRAMKLQIPWKLFKKGYCGQLLKKGWIDVIEIEV